MRYEGKSVKKGIISGLLFSVLCVNFCSICYASNQQGKIKIKIPAGTEVHITANKEISADSVKKYDDVDFVLSNPIKINNYVAVNAGACVKGRVTDKRNNFILGKPGSITLSDFRLELDNGEVVNLNGELYDEGLARWWANAAWIFCIAFPLLFVKGNDGMISQGTTKVLYTAKDFYTEAVPAHKTAI